MENEAPPAQHLAPLDISGNRRASKWSRREQAGRCLWALFQPFFRWSPRLFWGWRGMVLRTFGASIGKHVHIHPTARIFAPWNLTVGDFAAIGDRVILYNLGPMHLGAYATISQNAHLCAGTHDYTRADMPLIKLPIRISDGAWICADAFIGPDVLVGEQAIVGARAVIMRDVAAHAIVAGNPARVIGQRPPLKRS